MRLLLPLLLLWALPLFAGDNLLRDGDFEAPAVKGRTLKEQGGDPTRNGQAGGWISFRFQASGKEGRITGGLTDEVAHRGKQSLFIDFDHVTKAYQSAILVSNFIPVVSGTDYEVSIWGRADPKDQINPEGRSVYLKVEVDFFAKDANESVGDPFYAVKPLRGGKDRAPYFKPDAWNICSVSFTTPPDAVFAQITWRWETGSDPGEVNGVMFFDDAAMTGPPAPNPSLTPAPVQEETPAPEAPPAK